MNWNILNKISRDTSPHLMVMTWCHSCSWHMMREDRYIFFVHHFVMSVLSWAWADMFHNWSDCISSPLDVSSGGTQWSVDCEKVLSLRLSSVTSADIFSAGGNVKHKIQNSLDATGTMKEIFFLIYHDNQNLQPCKAHNWFGLYKRKTISLLSV